MLTNTRTILVEWGDCDPLGIVFYPRYFAWFDASTIALFAACVREGMKQLIAKGGGSSTFATRALLLEEPASIDAGEVTDKGYINQRAVIERRAALVESLYGDVPAANIITLEE